MRSPSGIFAVMRDGRELLLHPKYGRTLAELHESLRSNALTGSAVPLADAELDLADGSRVRYSDVNTWHSTESL